MKTTLKEILMYGIFTWGLIYYFIHSLYCLFQQHLAESWWRIGAYHVDFPVTKLTIPEPIFLPYHFFFTVTKNYLYDIWPCVLHTWKLNLCTGLCILKHVRCAWMLNIIFCVGTLSFCYFWFWSQNSPLAYQKPSHWQPLTLSDECANISEFY